MTLPDPPPFAARFGDRYRWERKLGEGGMAEVYLVFDRFEEREVALKVHKVDPSREDDLDYFAHEFRVLTQLQHPNLVRVYDYGTADDLAYYTCEFLDGHDLFDATADLDHDALFDLVRQALDGLAFIHDRGWVHYDVKPENMTVVTTPPQRPDERPTRHLKLVDFGLTGHATTRSGGKVKGTIQYLAPEVARSLPSDRRADLYSLGITLYYVLTRELPYDGSSALSIIRKHLESVPEAPTRVRAEVPDAWASFVLRLIEKDPDRRYPSAPAALEDLARRLGKPIGSVRAEAPGRALTPRLVGRERPLRILTDALTHSPPTPAAVWIHGDEGVGKTRLVYELKVRAQLQGVPVLAHACSPTHPAPFGHLVRLALDLPGVEPTPHESGALSRIFPDLLDLPHDPLPDAHTNPRAQTVEFLLRAAKPRPYLLILEDLRLADETTLDLLGLLLRSLPDSHRPLIVLTDRNDTPARASLASSWDPLEADARARTLPLHPLTLEDATAMLASMLALDLPTAHPLAAKLFPPTDGNPRHLEELVGHLLDERLLRLRHFTHADLERITPPTSLGDLLGQRLARLPQPAHDVLHALAVLAAPAPLPLVAATADLPGPDALDALDVLIRRHMAQRHAPDDLHDSTRYTTSHATVQRHLLRTLPPERARTLHTRALDALERLAPPGPTRDAVLDRLEHHARAAHDASRALDYALAAGLKARSDGNPRRAIDLLSRALDALTTLPDHPEHDRHTALALTHLSEVLSRVGRYADAARALERLLEHPLDPLGPNAAVWVRRRLGDLALKRGLLPDARRWLQDALSRTSPRSGYERARILEVMSRMALWRGDYLNVTALAQEAVELFRSLRRERDAPWALHILGCAAYFRGDTTRAAALLQETLQHARRRHTSTPQWLRRQGLPEPVVDALTRALDAFDATLPLSRHAGDPFGVVLSFSDLATFLDLATPPQLAADAYQALHAEYVRLGDAERSALALNNLGVTHRHLGDCARALELFDDSLALLEGSSDRQAAVVPLLNQALLRLALGDRPGALERAERALARARDLGITWLSGHCHRVLAHALPDPRDAHRQLQRGIGVFRMINNPRSLTDLLLDHAQLALDHPTERDDPADLLDKARDALPSPPPDIRARTHLIQAALHTPDLTRAAHELEAALRHARAAHLPELRLHVHTHLAHTYAQLDSARLALEHLERARDLETLLLTDLPPDLLRAATATPIFQRTRATERWLARRTLDP